MIKNIVISAYVKSSRKKNKADEHLLHSLLWRLFEKERLCDCVQRISVNIYDTISRHDSKEKQ